MSKLKTALNGNTGAMLAGGTLAVVLAFGAYIGFGGQGAAPVQVTATTPPSAGEGAPVRTHQSSEADAQSATTAPTFDELRREPDGTTIIAGRAAPLSDVQIFVDGKQVGTATADSTGGFAAIATLPAKDTAQVVSLSARKGAQVVASVDEIILAPSAGEQGAQMPDHTTSGAQTPAEPNPVGQVEAKAMPPQIAVLKSDATGVRLMSPRVTSEVALDTIGYSESGEVQLTGRAQRDTAKVRVYLDNRSVISLPVESDGRWRGDLPDVDEGVYTLRVDEVTAAGTVSSRVETPFQRESAQTLALASQDIDGPITSITVQTGATLWAIARDRYGDGTLFLRVVEANSDSIRNPDLIYPGQVFDLPN